MNGFKSKVFGKGRITIPKQIREKLGIEEGDYVEVEILKKMVLVEEKEVS